MDHVGAGPLAIFAGRAVCKRSGDLAAAEDRNSAQAARMLLAGIPGKEANGRRFNAQFAEPTFRGCGIAFAGFYAGQ